MERKKFKSPSSSIVASSSANSVERIGGSFKRLKTFFWKIHFLRALYISLLFGEEMTLYLQKFYELPVLLEPLPPGLGVLDV